MAKTVELPTIHQRACELPGGPLIAIMVALEERIGDVLGDHSAPSFMRPGEGTAVSVHRAVGVAVGMYYTPHQPRLDPEAYAVEMRETCVSMLHCAKRCSEAFAEAAQLEGGNVRYTIRVFAPPGADLSCLTVLDPEQIMVERVAVEAFSGQPYPSQ